jgi:hypothetical protein
VAEQRLRSRGRRPAHREALRLAKRLIEETCSRQNVEPVELTIPGDRGASKTVAPRMAGLGVTTKRFPRFR